MTWNPAKNFFLNETKVLKSIKISGNPPPHEAISFLLVVLMVNLRGNDKCSL